LCSMLEEATKWLHESSTNIKRFVSYDRIRKGLPMYKMPAEYQPHRATLMIWPVRPGSWGKDPRPAQAAFVRVFEAITQGEDLYLLAGPGHLEEARAATAHLDPTRVHLLCIDSDDAWARDVGPTFVQDEAGRLKGISWRFNAWGGAVDGLYAAGQKDDDVA